MVNESLTAELERYKERVTIFEQRQNVDLNKREKLIDSQMDDLIRNRNAKLEAFQQEIDTLKETLSNNVKEKESLSTTLTVFKTESKEKESKYIDKEIVLEKQNKELENIISLGYQNPFHLKKAQQIKPTLYDGSVIAKEHAMISMIDDEETLILEEESRSKMLDKQNDLISVKQKINISPIDYSKLNNLKEDLGKRFVTQQELSAEQAFWLKHSNYNPDTSVKSHTPVRIEAPSELPKTKTLLKLKRNNVGDRVLLFNSRLKIFLGKLKTRWSGPFSITKVFPYRTIELSQLDGPNFKVNGHRVKHYFGGDLPPKEVHDLHTLP
ncbi:hypothetical protein Tco_0530422 [Tanacetum coccineum]